MRGRVMVTPMVSGDGFALHLRAGAITKVCAQLGGISRPALGRRLGLAESTVYRLDRGDVRPSADTVGALIVISGLDFGELFVVVEDGER